MSTYSGSMAQGMFGNGFRSTSKPRADRMNPRGETLQSIVYVIDGDPSARETTEQLMRSVQLHAMTFASPEDFLQTPLPDVPSCLVLDVRLTGVSGLDLQLHLTRNGIHLPVLGAFKLLGRLAGSRLPLTSSGARPLDDIVANGVSGQPEIDGMATRDGDAIQVLVWNYHDDLVPSPASPVHLAIKLPPGFGPRVRASHLRLDESHGDAYTAWVAQGMPASPTALQVATLKKVMDPSPLTPDRTLALNANGSVELDFDLPRFGVSLITLLPTAGELDDGDPTSAGPSAGSCACRAHGRTEDGAGQLGLGALMLALLAGRRNRRRVALTETSS